MRMAGNGTGYVEPGVVGEDRQLHAVRAVELREQVRDVGLDGRLAHEQRGADLGVGAAARQLDEHLPLAGRQRRQGAGVRGRAAGGIGTVGDVGDEPAGDRRRQHRVAGRDDADRLLQVARRRVLEQEAVGAGLQGAEHVVVDVERREDEDARRVGELADRHGRGEAVEARHADVHQHHVGRAAPDRLDGVGPVLGLADDRDVVGRRRGSCAARRARGPRRR